MSLGKSASLSGPSASLHNFTAHLHHWHFALNAYLRQIPPDCRICPVQQGTAVFDHFWPLIHRILPRSTWDFP